MADELLVSFQAQTQAIEALRAAAYRLIGIATCQISEVDGTWICKLERSDATGRRNAMASDELRDHFINLVTDENLRLSIEKRTEPLRNVILSLAFGALTQDRNAK